jgi:DNA-binding transcriptional LysR family regulator
MAPGNRNISLRALRAFCVAAEQESFRDAADRLFITASAVSHQIKNLEDELGNRLFERRSRSLALTDAGKLLLDEIRPLIARFDDVTSRHSNGQARTTLSISVQPFFASELFVARLAEFTAANQEIDIKIDTSDESAEKHPANADVSIRVFKSPPENLAADRLFPLRLVPAAAPALRDRLRLRNNIVTSEFPLIIHDTRPTAWQQWQRSSGIKLPKGAMSLRLDSMIAVARAAERGLGAALVPAQLSDSWFRDGSLVRLFPDELTTDDAYYLVSRKDDAQRVGVLSLRNWALDNFSDLR